jgi:glucan 1,4-alpha-glucosidase
MKTILFLLLLTFSINIFGQEVYIVSSPDTNIRVEFSLRDNSRPSYEVFQKDKRVIGTSFLSFDLEDAPSLNSGFMVVNTERAAVNETWPMPWGEQLEVVNNYNELKVDLSETSGLKRKMSISFRVFDDGMGFRYEFPEQENLSEVFINNENTEFSLTGDHMAFWAPGDWDIYEHLYSTSPVSKINAISKRDHPSLGQHTYIPENAVNTPLTLRTDDGLHLSFHEAKLIDYSDMTLKVDTLTYKLTSSLVGSENTDYKVKRTTPFETPWRTVIIVEKATQLIDSKLMLNLNDPNKLGDVSWFKPTKYTGIWWEMHLGKSSWDMNTGKHGATTENAKRLIDFSAENGIGAMLVEGWNTGWEPNGVFDFVTPYEDYDIEEVINFGKSKGVDIVMHHETYSGVTNYEKHLDTAYALMQKYGMHVVKSGYVGKIIPRGEYHHGQYMVNHYNNAAIKAAEYQVAVNIHEPIKGTGLRRTYPNIVSREGLRGQEFNAWASDGGNPPEHLPIVAFTRMLSGPIDYTPGIFNIKFNEYKKDNQVNTTLAHQLALYVVVYSPVQMVPDLIEHYEGQPAFQFIRDVGVDWKQTLVLNGEVGDFVTIAREDRDSDNWFLGAITDENARNINIDLDFLPEGKFKAVIYEDGKDAHWDKNPTSINVREQIVERTGNMEFDLAPGGGVAVSFEKL